MRFREEKFSGLPKGRAAVAEWRAAYAEETPPQLIKAVGSVFLAEWPVVIRGDLFAVDRQSSRAVTGVITEPARGRPLARAAAACAGEANRSGFPLYGTLPPIRGGGRGGRERTRHPHEPRAESAVSGEQDSLRLLLTAAALLEITHSSAVRRCSTWKLDYVRAGKQCRIGEAAARAYRAGG